MELQLPPQRAKIFEALSKAQAQIKNALKDSSNPFFKSKYADLASVWEACREPLTKNGLSVSQLGRIDNGQFVLVTVLGHTSGEELESVMPVTPVKNDPQSLGSAITYMRRYALQAIAGIAADDDDGNHASHAPITPKHYPAEHNAPSKALPQDDDYVPSFGKFKGIRLAAIPDADLAGYVSFLNESAVRQNKPITGQVKEFIDRATAQLAGK